MSWKILIVEDDADTAGLLQLVLKALDAACTRAADGPAGLKLAYELQPDLVILDVMMPGMDGFEVCRRLREISDVPILILTARGQDASIQKGFALGADEYLKKPFSNAELLARVDYLLKRRSTAAASSTRSFSDGSLALDFINQRASLFDQPLNLSATEYRLLEFFARNPRKTLSARTLLREVWGEAYSQDKALLCFYIHQLRQKLSQSGGDHKYIQTQWGQGYLFNPRFECDPPAEPAAPPALPASAAEPAAPPCRQRRRWAWLPLAVLAILLILGTFQREVSFAAPTGAQEQRTVIRAHLSAEGISGAEQAGARGEVCVENAGAAPTENLAIVTTVQIYTPASVRYAARVLDLGSKPVLLPGETHCYPFLVSTTAAAAGQRFRATTAITITNHNGAHSGGECPGTTSCPYGHEISADFHLPQP